MASKDSGHRWPIVIFDSSIVIGIFESRADLLREIERVLSKKFEPVVLTGTLREIENAIKRSKGAKRRKALALALSIAEKFNKLDFSPLGEEEMDDVIFRVARHLGAAVATNDTELRRRLVEAGVPVLFVREKSHIEANGYTENLKPPSEDSFKH